MASLPGNPGLRVCWCFVKPELTRRCPVAPELVAAFTRTCMLWHYGRPGGIGTFVRPAPAQSALAYGHRKQALMDGPVPGGAARRQRPGRVAWVDGSGDSHDEVFARPGRMAAAGR